MNNKKLYDMLEKAEDMEIMTWLSASIEYLVNARDCDFNRIIKHLKKAHKYIESKRGVE